MQNWTLQSPAFTLFLTRVDLPQSGLLQFFPGQIEELLRFIFSVHTHKITHFYV